jgi:hypothetical protein
VGGRSEGAPAGPRPVLARCGAQRGPEDRGETQTQPARRQGQRRRPRGAPGRPRPAPPLRAAPRRAAAPLRLRPRPPALRLPRSPLGLLSQALLLLLAGAALLVWRGRGGSGGGGGSGGAWRAPPAGPDMRLAPRLLPLTNFSALTTAALLDAHAGAGAAEARALVQLHQELYCRCVRDAGAGSPGARALAAPPRHAVAAVSGPQPRRRGPEPAALPPHPQTKPSTDPQRRLRHAQALQLVARRVQGAGKEGRRRRRRRRVAARGRRHVCVRRGRRRVGQPQGHQPRLGGRGAHARERGRRRRCGAAGGNERP